MDIIKQKDKIENILKWGCSHLVKIIIDKDSRNNIKDSYSRLKNILSSGQTVYGVNTGFGRLSQIKINESDQIKLQKNLVRSHSAGLGTNLDVGTARVIILLKALVAVTPTAANNICGIKNGIILHNILNAPRPISAWILLLVASSTKALSCPKVIGPCALQNPFTLHILSVTSADGATNPLSGSVLPPS